jgi:hypothetical protein
MWYTTSSVMPLITTTPIQIQCRKYLIDDCFVVNLTMYVHIGIWQIKYINGVYNILIVPYIQYIQCSCIHHTLYVDVRTVSSPLIQSNIHMEVCRSFSQWHLCQTRSDSLYFGLWLLFCSSVCLKILCGSWTVIVFFSAPSTMSLTLSKLIWREFL